MLLPLLYMFYSQQPVSAANGENCAALSLIVILSLTVETW